MTLSPLMSGVLAQIKQQAGGRIGRPMRFVFCVKCNGLWAEMIQPRGMEGLLPFDLAKLKAGDSSGGGRGSITPKADTQIAEGTKLSGVMSALEPFSDRVSVIQGIDSAFSVYHTGCYQVLGAFQARRRDTQEVGGPTVDSILGRALHRPLPHLCLGQDDGAPSGLAYVPTSAEDAGKPESFYVLPARAYRDLFGVIDQGKARNAYDAQTDVLDFFADDARRLRTEVAGPEREQLDRYLDAFDAVRHSRAEIEAMSDTLRRFAPAPPPQLNPQEIDPIAQSNTEIAIAALLSGLTNVVTLQFDQLASGSIHSTIGHKGEAARGKREAKCTFMFNQVARIAAALNAVPEGDGTMLDNTLIVFTSDNGETHHSRGVNWPIVLVGDLSGRLRRRRYFAPTPMADDKHDRDRTVPGSTRLGDVWATLLAAAGQPYEGFGRPLNGQAHRPIEALLA